MDNYNANEGGKRNNGGEDSSNGVSDEGGGNQEHLERNSTHEIEKRIHKETPFWLDHGKVKFGSLMGALKTGAHQLKVVNFDPNYLNNVCFF